MSKSECVAADWEQRGVLDGSRGALVSTLEQHDNACAKVSIVPDQDKYLQGYEQGLLIYCTAESGLSEGLANSEYLGVCPSDMEAEFLASYIDGLELTLIELESESFDLSSRLFQLRLESSVPKYRANKNLRQRIYRNEQVLKQLAEERYDIRSRIAAHRQQLNLLR
ncbi:DUF2799 domain-containing protein [Granulosicoccus sp.]|nr:DUF2799 domain-containing protein [Granulosicoccus sp.]